MRREDTALDLCGLGIAGPEGSSKAADEGPEAARDSARKALAALEAEHDVAVAVEPAPGALEWGCQKNWQTSRDAALAEQSSNTGLLDLADVPAEL